MPQALALFLRCKQKASVCDCIEGGSADVLDLRAGDEVIAVDGADVAHHYLESVESVIKQAVGVGQLQLRIRRLVIYSQSLSFLSLRLVLSLYIHSSFHGQFLQYFAH